MAFQWHYSLLVDLKSTSFPYPDLGVGSGAAQRLVDVVTNTALNNSSKDNRESQAVFLQAAGH